ncbi:unnamed protein product [Victoria cruziana]
MKKMTVVPSGKDLVDIVLSRTQRQTPTVVHKGYAISRIRQFYMRKVKFTQTTFHEKLSNIIDEFPRLDDIHPFYSDLLHVLYNKDHYKLALAQVNTARSLIARVAKDYVRLLKFGDSLYRCKTLKVAALGRMCTIIKRIGPSLAYLEQVRQHMSRLPSIDPNTRTILICGFPNVGKSSFINKITRADVDVQPYAFTTKSLFVGHTDYKYLRYQVIDTPGILDRPFEDRNIIEMCSITALAHLRAAILFFLDVSGSCGYTVKQQASLFHSIKSLFANKPLIIVCNKIDLQSLESLPEEDLRLVTEMKEEAAKTAATAGGGGEEDKVLLTMSTLTDTGVMEVKMKSKKMNECLNRFHVAIPKPRDNKERPPCIPQAVLEARARETAAAGGGNGEEAAKMNNEGRKLEKDLEDENGGAGVYSASLKKHYILANDEWKEDIMPEILDGHNVYDFVDSDIMARLEELEREEGLRLQTEEGKEDEEMEGVELTGEEQKVLAEIRKKKSLLIREHRLKKSTAESKPVVPRKFDKDRKFTAERMGRELSKLGMDPSRAVGRARSRSVTMRGRKRERSAVPGGDGGADAMDVDNDLPNKKLRLRDRSRSRSRPPSGEIVLGEGFRDSAQKQKALALAKKSAKKRNKAARRGEADRVIPNLKPKHLFSGKRSIGKTDRR